MNETLMIFSQSDSVEDREELVALAEAAQLHPAHLLTYREESISARTLIGKGKCQEVLDYLHEHPETEMVLFSTRLSSLQARELEKIFERPVLDSTDCILLIFQKRARTREARLQVESVLLQRQRNRLAGFYGRMERQRGNAMMRGTGEKQIDLDKRKIQTRLAQNAKELKKLKNQRDIQRRSRLASPLPIVALAGYTNAGKSTIMNHLLKLTGSDREKLVLEEDALFATLDTSLRLIELPYGQSFLLADTVGFIQHLPHELIEAFQSTLEDITLADLILHVTDASSPQNADHLRVASETLETIGAASLPQLPVYTHCDKAELAHPQADENRVCIDARSEADIAFLLETILDRQFGSWQTEELFLPWAQSHRMAQIRNLAEILQEEPGETGVQIRIRFRQKNGSRIQALLKNQSA